MNNIIEIYAKMILDGDWNEDKIPPQILELVQQKMVEFREQVEKEKIEGGEH